MKPAAILFDYLRMDVLCLLEVMIPDSVLNIDVNFIEEIQLELDLNPPHQSIAPH